MTPDSAFQQMKNSFEGGRLAQAYVVTAPPRGAGSDFALRLLQLVFCESGDRPCGRCGRCVEVAGGAHPDVLWIEPQKKSRVISVDQIRDVEQRIYHTSFRGGWKACVLLGADRMSSGAANAFLKTLEEPPARSIFLLLTDGPQFLLPTIISRCQRLTLSGDYSVLPERWSTRAFEVLTDTRGGGIMAALAGSDRLVGLLKEMKKEAVEVEAARLTRGDEEVGTEVLDARAGAMYREMRTSLMRLVLRWHRDILLLVSGGDEGLVHNHDHLEFLRSVAGRIAYRNAVRNVTVVETMNRHLESNLPDAQVFAAGWGELS